MNIKLMMLGLVAAGLVACAQESDTTVLQQDVSLDTEIQKLSYAMGMDVGRSLKELDAGIDADAFTLAVRDALAGQTMRLDDASAVKMKQDFFRKKQEERMAKRAAEAEENKVKGEAFLADNAKKAGVKVTASGLQYEVITMGDGEKPKADSKVKVHYRGTTIDGVEFDSSYSRGQPISFPLNGVIKGWSEGVALMPVGSKFRFFIPSELAYGERGAGAKIGPNSTLIFEVELLAIEK